LRGLDVRDRVTFKLAVGYTSERRLTRLSGQQLLYSTFHSNASTFSRPEQLEWHIRPPVFLHCRLHCMEHTMSELRTLLELFSGVCKKKFPLSVGGLLMTYKCSHWHHRHWHWHFCMLL